MVVPLSPTQLQNRYHCLARARLPSFDLFFKRFLKATIINKLSY